MTGLRQETFDIDRTGWLVHSVVPTSGRGQPYEHRCSFDSFKAVVFAAEDLASVGFTGEDLAHKADVPLTQAAVALAFLKERGCIVAERKRNYLAGDDLHLDAMIEWHALREGAPGSR